MDRNRRTPAAGFVVSKEAKNVSGELNAFAAWDCSFHRLIQKNEGGGGTAFFVDTAEWTIILMTNHAAVREWEMAVPRRGLTLLEIVIALAIIGILVSLAIPAVLWSRNAARAMTCSNNLRQIGLAIANYESQWTVFPSGLSHKYDLLPFLGYSSLYASRLPISASPVRVWEIWKPLEPVVVPVYVCPTDGAEPRLGDAGVAATSYAGCAGTGVLDDGFNGVFTFVSNPYPDTYPTGYLGYRDCTDGSSNTIAMSEILHADGNPARLRTLWFTPERWMTREEFPLLLDFCERIPPDPTAFGYQGDTGRRGVPWFNGDFGCGMYTNSLPPNHPSCRNGGNSLNGVYTAASLHPGGVHVLYLDGRVEFVAQDIDRATWRDLGSRTSRR